MPSKHTHELQYGRIKLLSPPGPHIPPDHSDAAALRGQFSGTHFSSFLLLALHREEGYRECRTECPDKKYSPGPPKSHNPLMDLRILPRDQERKQKQPQRQGKYAERDKWPRSQRCSYHLFFNPFLSLILLSTSARFRLFLLCASATSRSSSCSLAAPSQLPEHSARNSK